MLKLKAFRQTTGYCGPASLKIVLEFFGVKKSEKSLARLAKTNKKKGTSAKGLLLAAKKLGFDGFLKDFASFCDIKMLVNNKKIPVIVDWFSVDEGHYSVVYGINDKSIFLIDPETAKTRRFKPAEFKRVWFDFQGAFLTAKEQIIIRRMIVVFPKKKPKTSKNV